MASEGSIQNRSSPALLLALTLAGLAGNYFRYPVFFNIDFIFGSIFAMLALQFLGLRRALLATLVIGSSTFFLWHHPYALVIAVAEMAVVGWLVTRRKMGMVLADTLFWLCLGMPLVYLFYQGVMHFPTSNVDITMVKQAMNGITNALIARLLFTGHSLTSRTLTISFREILYNLLALFVLFPSLILLAVSSRADFIETDHSIRSSLSRDSSHISNSLEHWINARRVLAVNMAELATTLPPQQMQARLEQAKASDPYLLRIGLHDRDAVVVAHAPSTDATGQTVLGRSFADRPFIPRLKRTLKPMLSEMVLGKIDPVSPRALMLAPVQVDGTYNGYIAVVLNLERVRAILAENASGEGMLYTLLDNNGKIILTNRQDQKAMTPLGRGQGELKRLDDGTSQWSPSLPPGAPTAERWAKSLYIKKTSVGTFAEWDLILEQPVAPFQTVLFDSYANKLGLLFVIFIVALLVAEILSRLIHSSILRLGSLTRDLPVRLAQGQQVTWPESPVLELRDLVANFREMTGSLTARFGEIRQFNETLELRVAERTEQLGRLNQDFVSFLENTSDFIYYKDQDSRFRFCSQTLASITGHANWRDMIGKHDREVFPEDTARCYIEEELPIFRDGVALLNKTNPYYDPQGDKGWVSTNKWPVFDKSGKVVGLFGISRDITELMQTQESLRLARQSLDQVPDAIMWADPQGRIVDCNQGACNCLGYSQQELLGRSIFSIDPLTTAENWSDSFAQCREQRVLHCESSYLTKAGQLIPMDIQVTHVSFGDKEFLCGVGRDLTERKLMEAERLSLERRLLHVQKLESLGVLSGGIAHDFNNLLQVVLGNLDLSLMILPGGEPVRKNLEQAVIATVRASELSGMMLAYSGKGVLTVKELNLSDLMQENAPMLAAVIPESVSFSTSLHGALPPVQADAAKLLQVVLSLVRNASEAIGAEGGSVTLSTGVQQFDRASLDASRLEETIPEGRYVWMEVSDTGCGMDEMTQYKIFDPFFSTKFTGRGLGMSAALGIMRAHKGAILLESSPGAGTKVRLLFPIARVEQEMMRALPGVTRNSAVMENGARDLILIVDDEQMIRTLSAAILDALGFDTLVAQDGGEALEIFRREGSRIVLVLLDQSMPFMDGVTVFTQMRRILPEVKVLLASGYSAGEVSARFEGLGLNGFIQKPFNVKHLSDEIQRVLQKQVLQKP